MPKGIYKHKPLSAETKLKMSLSKRGEKHPMFGRKHSKNSLLKMSKSHLNHKCTPEHRQKISKALKGKIPKNLEFLHRVNKGNHNANWKGDNVKHSALHTWVNRWKVKPKICKICKSSQKRLAWSNIDHKYKRNLNDYVALCYKCHQDFDKLNNNYPIKNHNQFTS